MAKLFPPFLESKLPAAYWDSEGIHFNIPFQHNEAITNLLYDSFSVKIKTASTNKEVYTFTLNPGEVENGAIRFVRTTVQLEAAIGDKFPAPYFNVGQFYKVQLAYKKDGEIGIYSNVGIMKCTTKGSIENFDFKALGADCSFKYIPPDVDPQESLYSYEITLGSSSSGELFYNIEQENCSYSFNKPLLTRGSYSVKCSIITINGLQIIEYYTIQITASSGDSLPSLSGSCDYDAGIISINNIPSGSILIRDEADILASNATDYLDRALEQGVKYKYCAYSETKTSNSGDNPIKITVTKKANDKNISADYETIFLSDKNKQLAIAFDPKMSSYKTVIQEQKQDTIGGQYPFILRNGAMNYKEFPISGLISYHMDTEEKFMNKSSLNLASDTSRQSTNANSSSLSNTPTVQLTGYNIAAERRFKNAVLDWLNNGEPKLFRSPTEGCFIVRLTSVSLSPKDELGRMLHSFSATAHEIDEYNIQNLKKYNLI